MFGRTYPRGKLHFISRVKQSYIGQDFIIKKIPWDGLFAENVLSCFKINLFFSNYHSYNLSISDLTSTPSQFIFENNTWFSFLVMRLVANDWAGSPGHFLIREESSLLNNSNDKIIICNANIFELKVT